MIEGIRRLASRARGRAVVRGIGDDCAILQIKPGQQLLVTTDLCVENVHFRRPWHPARSVGHRCLTRGVSDIAAMGGEPLACFLSLGLPARLPQRWVNDFLEGLTALARRFHVELAGGDISSAKEVVADIIVIGQIPADRAVLRSGARPGDRVYVTGELGGSGKVLQRLFAGERVRASTGDRHFYPEPRVQVGQWLRRRKLVTAMIDISDGLSVDLHHICEESRVDAVISGAAVPVSPGATFDLALDSGDDYELLFTARPKTRIPSRIGGVKITEIGVIRRSLRAPAITLSDSAGRSRRLKPRGWQHFSEKR
ncbi:MAG TPA: thiamine-phosphate kinase [Candidatus Angelobacter sp.]|nr:thiamine-phosphate kinase [Candidatus Angelobacter sp.]